MSSLLIRSLTARASVARTLRGARPAGKRLRKRFRHILRRAREEVVTTTYDANGENPREVRTTFSRAGLAGYLTELARQESRS